MKVVLVYPQTQSGLEELSRQVSGIHASAVASYLKGLHCPPEQKLALIRVVQNTTEQSKG